MELKWHSQLLITKFSHSQSFDRSACIWDVRTGRCVKRFDQNESDVNAVRFLPTGDALGTTTNDGVVSCVLLACLLCTGVVGMAVLTCSGDCGDWFEL